MLLPFWFCRKIKGGIWASLACSRLKQAAERVAFGDANRKGVRLVVIFVDYTWLTIRQSVNIFLTWKNFLVILKKNFYAETYVMNGSAFPILPFSEYSALYITPCLYSN